MRTRLVPWLALLGLALLPAAARPEQATAAKPSVVLRLASLDTLREDARYLSELAGQEEVGKQLDALIKQLTGPRGLAGIDTKKPIGAYAYVGPLGLDSIAVVLLPIADEKDFLALAENLGGGNKPEKVSDVYTLNIEKIPYPLYFRFADKYCYLTVKDKEAIDKDKLLTPAAILPGPKAGTLSVTVNVDQIPANLKQAALSQIDLQLAQIKERGEPKETPAQSRLRMAILDELSLRIKSLLRDGGPIDLRLELDRKAGDATLSASLAGKAGSPLAASIAELGKVRAWASTLIGSDSALGGLIDVTLPDKVKGTALSVLDEMEKKALARQKDEPQRKALQAVLEAIKPTLKSGVLDAGLNLRGPNTDGIYTVVAGVKVKEGEKIDKSLHKIVADLPPEVRELIKLDFDKVDKAVVHRLTVPGDAQRDVPLGDNPVFLAVRSDALLIAGGDKGLEVLKEVLGSSAKVSSLARVEVSLGRLAPLIEKETKGAVEAAREAFSRDKDAGKVRITLEGGPALQVRLTAKTQLLKFFVLLDKLKKGEK
jgi:hypothetical protein